MNNLSLHFNDCEVKSEKNAFLVLKYKCCYTQVLEPGVQRICDFFVITYYLCKFMLKFLT